MRYCVISASASRLANPTRDNRCCGATDFDSIIKLNRYVQSVGVTLLSYKSQPIFSPAQEDGLLRCYREMAREGESESESVAAATGWHSPREVFRRA